MGINQSNHFRYGAFTNSSSEIIEKVPVLETVMSSYTEEKFPSISLEEITIEFLFEMDRSLYMNMPDTHFSLKHQLFNGKLFEKKSKT